jgi:hypothetical protein
VNSRRNFLRSTAAGGGGVCLSAVLAACSSGHADGLDNCLAPSDPAPEFTESELTTRLKKVTGGTAWKLVNEVSLNFDVHHPQSMQRIDGLFYLSSVEILQPTTRYPEAIDGYDRSEGQGRGHVFVFDEVGRLVQDIELGEGAMYHPGGIDFDGTDIWVPCAEYRPNSRSVVYKVNPVTAAVTRVFEYGDHIGGISLNTDTNTLHAVSWGARRFYRFALDAARTSSPDFSVSPEELRQLNRSFYIDYQENQYLGGNEMLFTGVASYRSPNLDSSLSFGGFEIVDLATGLPTHLVPIKLWSPKTDRVMTQNPCFMELSENGVRAYFVPDDGMGVSMYVYEAAV